jgi:hypothetical protein
VNQIDDEKKGEDLWLGMEMIEEGGKTDLLTLAR